MADEALLASAREVSGAAPAMPATPSAQRSSDGLLEDAAREAVGAPSSLIRDNIVSAQGKNPAQRSSDALLEDAAREAVGAQSSLIRNNLVSAQGKNPAQESQIQTLAKSTGLPPDTVRAMPDAAQTQATLNSTNTDTMAQQFPHLAQFMTHPDNAAQVHTFIPQMAATDEAMSAMPKATPEATPAGASWVDSVENAPLELAKGFAGATNKAASAVNLALGAIPTAYDKLAEVFGGNSHAAADWWYRNMVTPRLEGQQAFEPTPNAGFAEKASNMAGSLLGMLNQIVLTGGESAAIPATASAGEFGAAMATNATKTMVAPAITSAIDTGQKVYAATGDPHQAFLAAQEEYLSTTAVGAGPLSAAGGLAKRVATGLVSGAAIYDPQRQAANTVMPDSMQQPFDFQQLLLSGLSGAMLGGAMGPRGEVSHVEAVRKTYLDAMSAQQSEADLKSLHYLGEVAEANPLRTNNPEAFKQFLQTMADDHNLSDVYVKASDLDTALKGNIVEGQTFLQKMPEVAAQINEQAGLGGDVRIPIADYATYVAGKPLGEVLLPNLKTSPGGMTYAEGQEHFKNATADMRAQAEKIGTEQSAIEQQKAEQQQVHDNVLGQLNTANTFPKEVNRTYATLAAAGYDAQAKNAGMTTQELWAQKPLNIAGGQLGADVAPLGGEAKNSYGEKGNLSPADAAIEAQFRTHVTNHEDIAGAYAKLKDSEGGKMLNTDIARELSPHYLADRTKSAAVHEPASDVVKKLFADKLASTEHPLVLFTAGGTGAGKTTAVAGLSHVADIAKHADIIYDTNMNTYDSAKSKVQEALDAGGRAQIALVVRHPVDALVNGALPRAERQRREFGTGRTVPLDKHIKTHRGAISTVLRLAEEYKDNPDVKIIAIDNSRGKGNAVELPLAKLKELDYTGIEAKVKDALEEEYRNGKISEATYRGFKQSGQNESATPGAGASLLQRERADPRGQLEPERNGTTAGEPSAANTKHPTVNVGLNVNDGSKITEAQARAALEKTGVKVLEGRVHASNTEPTLVAHLSRALTPEEAHQVSVELKQDAIAQHTEQGGKLYGPEAAKWGAFDPKEFMRMDGSKLSEPSVSDAQRASEAAAGGVAPLEGLPTRPIKLDKGWYVPGPFKKAHDAAETYTKSAGIEYQPPTRYVEVNVARARRIAEAYEAMPHDPGNPEVKAAYAALIKEAFAQYETLLKTGIKIEFIPKGAKDPYGANPRGFIEDVTRNNHMWVLSTREGFGTEAKFDPKDNPLLAETEHQIGGQKALANDIFRVVHDYFGHAKDGVGFRAAGEENAWREHASMFSPVARKALTTETRGQNSWLNYGPHGESNRTAKTEDTHFADQKTGLLPQWAVDEGRVDGKGVEVQGAHFSNKARPVLSGKFYGTGLKGAEARRLSESDDPRIKNRVSFYVDEGAGVHPEAGVGGVRHDATLPNMYDLRNDPLHLASHDSNKMESAILDAGFNGYYLKDWSRGQGAAVVMGDAAKEIKAENTQGAVDNLKQTMPTDVGLSAQTDMFAHDFADKRSTISEVRRVSSRGSETVTEQKGNVNSSGNQITSTKTGLQNFWDWFGDSKTVNEEGKPTVLYHGTAGDFSTFEAGRTTTNTGLFGVPYEAKRAGMFFTPESAFAEGYHGEKSGSNMRQDYVRMENPADFRHGLTDVLWNSLESAGYNPKNILDLQHDWEMFDEEHGGSELVKALKDKGYDGAIINEADEEGKAHEVYVAFDPEQIKSATGNRGTFDPRETSTLLQDARAAYTPDTSTIHLLKDADLSSFVHELGHHFLELTDHLADSSPAIRHDMDTLLNWFGKTPEEWGKMTLAEREPSHEKFAEGFERYLMEGQAPSLELRPVFARVRNWMVSVYKGLQGLFAARPQAEQLTPEVRQVFDRMLATEDAVKQAEAVKNYEPLFKSAKDAGMSEQAYSDYISLGERATSQAVTDMERKGMRDMRWLSGAKSKMLKAMQRDANGKRDAIRAEVTKEVEAQPIEQAHKRLTEGEVKLSKSDLKAMGVSDTDIAKLKGMVAADGIHPDMAADSLGLGSGDTLVSGLLNREDPTHAIDGLTDQRMLEQYGELSDPQAIERAANQAISNEARARFMATGLKVLTKSPISASALAKAAKAVAEESIGQKKVKELHPAMYDIQEAKANKEALKAAPKDPQGAIKAQREALLNNRMSRAANDALDDVRKGMDYLKRFSKDSVRQKVDLDIRDQIDDLLSRFDLRQNVTNAPTRAQQSLKEWVASQEAAGYTPLVTPDMADPTIKMHYKEMAVNQFRGLVDTVKTLEHIGKERNYATIAGERTNVDEYVRNRLAPKILERGVKFTPEQLFDRAEDRHTNPIAIAFDHFNSWRRMAAAELLPQSHKANIFDRHEILGPFNESITSRVIDANYSKVRMLKGLSDDFQKQADVLGRDWQNSMRDSVMNDRLVDPDTGKLLSMTRGRMIGLAVNVGNESNFHKMTVGWNFQGDDVWRFLHNNMSEKDWQATQAVWDLYEKHWPEVEAMNRRLGNTSPDKIEARPFKTNFGEQRGGYAAIKYDPLRSRRGEKEAAGNAINPSEGLYGRGYFRADTTTNGSLNSRLDNYTDRVDLDFHGIPQRLQETIHDLAYRETLIDVNKIIEHPEFRKAVRSVYGREAYKSVQDWLGNLANGSTQDAQIGALGKFLQYTRTGMVMNAIAFRASTVIKHGGSAAFKSAGYFAGGGEQFFARRMAAMGTNYTAEIVGARQKFGEIYSRLLQQDRDFKQASTTMFEPESIQAKGERFGHAMVAWSDMMTAVPTAWAAYDRAITVGIPKGQGGTGKPMTEAQSVDYANRIVREAHGSYTEAGRAQVLSVKSEAMKMFTTLYSFMNNAYGQQLDGFDKLRTAGIDKAPVLARTFMAVIVPALVAEWTRENFPKEETLAGWAAWTGKAIADEVAATVPFVRDAVSMVEGYKGAGMVASENWLASLVQSGKDIATGKGKPIRDIANTAGMTLHIPGLGQLGSSAQYAEDVNTGKKTPQSQAELVKGVIVGH